MKHTVGINRAAKHAGGIDKLAELIGVAPASVKRWRREDPLTALQRAIAKAGTQGKLAALLGTAQTTVSVWLRQDQPAPPRPAPTNAMGRAVATAGGQPAMAARLGVSQQAVAEWVKKGYAPAARAQEIEMHYGVPRTDLISPKLRNAMGAGGEL